MQRASADRGRTTRSAGTADKIRQPYAFISYRRADSVAAARGIYRFLQSCFGKNSVFMDIPEIRCGSDWRKSIERALARASVVIPLIGSQWMTLTNAYGRLRIDDEKDWVRREIVHGLTTRKLVLPVVIGSAQLPAEDALTGALRPLARRQSLNLRDASWEADLDALATQLQAFHFERARTGVQFPRPTITIAPLSESQLTAARESLDGWAVTASQLPDMPHVTRNELFRKFEFRSFGDAIGFMHAASAKISRANHHPRWENIWRTVNVWLATWDVEFQISALDIALARDLDAAYRAYCAGNFAAPADSPNSRRASAAEDPERPKRAAATKRRARRPLRSGA